MLGRRRLEVALVGFLFASALLQCTPFDAAQSSAPEATSDAGSGAHEASTDAPNDVMDANAPPNLLPNPSFETNCAEWLDWHSTILWSPVGHVREGSCIVCMNAGATQGFSINSKPIASATPGRYEGTIWVRSAAEAPPVSDVEIRIVVRAQDANGNQQPLAEGTPVILGPTWQRLTVSRDVTTDNSTIDLYAWGPIPPAIYGTCFVADDASLVRVDP